MREQIWLLKEILMDFLIFLFLIEWLWYGYMVLALLKLVGLIDG